MEKKTRDDSREKCHASPALPHPSPLPTADNDDSSDDDEPLIKMVRKAGPSEEQLRETVQRLLENASLEEMTMKQICQRVRREGGEGGRGGQPGRK